MAYRTASNVLIQSAVVFSIVFVAAGCGSGPIAPSEPVQRIIAYYLHGTVRCETCLSIEREASEIVKATFSEHMDAGRLQWQALDYEQPENAHFFKEFALSHPGLVLAHVVGARIVKWKVLERTWDLIQEPPSFASYVEEEVGVFLANVTTNGDAE